MGLYRAQVGNEDAGSGFRPGRTNIALAAKATGG